MGRLAGTLLVAQDLYVLEVSGPDRVGSLKPVNQTQNASLGNIALPYNKGKSNKPSTGTKMTIKFFKSKLKSLFAQE